MVALLGHSLSSQTLGAGEHAPPDSPRLKALQEQLEKDQAGALAAFWREVEEQGTPLVESVPDDGRQRLVTFLWRGREDTRNVVVVGGVVPPWA